jgi:hypothetical protein
VGTAPESFVATAVADLAERLGVDPDAVEVVSADAVVWPDAGLGCPAPGMSYAQVQVEGTRIVLAHDGGEYPYHSGGSRGPFLCE